MAANEYERLSKGGLYSLEDTHAKTMDSPTRAEVTEQASITSVPQRDGLAWTRRERSLSPQSKRVVSGMVMSAEADTTPVAAPSAETSSREVAMARGDTCPPAPIRAQSLSRIAQFYFPRHNGAAGNGPAVPDALSDLKNVFSDDKGSLKRLAKEEFLPVIEHLGFPRYTSWALFHRVAGPEGVDVAYQDVERVWKKLRQTCHDDVSLLFALLKQEDSRLLRPRDFHPVIRGLEFLSSMPVFQEKYLETVVARIFYPRTRNYTTGMTLAEFRKTGFLDLIKNLETEDDINSTRDIFSYKHFYVIYCKFWELDTDHDMLIDLQALTTYDSNTMTSSILQRVIRGAGRPSTTGLGGGRMSYTDFVWFLMSAEDKMTPHAIEYWFRCLDVDGDGVLSLHEIAGFWEEQYGRLQEFRMVDPWRFGDFVCSLLDLIRPVDRTKITLSDLKRCGCASQFFDMLFDIRKYETHLRKVDPAFRETDEVWVTDKAGQRLKLEGWDKFAERAYEELAFEESQQQRSSSNHHHQNNTETYGLALDANDYEDDETVAEFSAFVEDLDRLDWDDARLVEWPGSEEEDGAEFMEGEEREEVECLRRREGGVGGRRRDLEGGNDGGGGRRVGGLRDGVEREDSRSGASEEDLRMG
ncbi:Serine/threonine-protein phosphatase 2A regulatory subunit B'' subunit alpha [Rhizophlyctis rosea]|nr:Serine/threonine-protein phosphatase 2A regulatory subunit B'' subunit alpha [Rhizophlyctis rosea]